MSEPLQTAQSERQLRAGGRGERSAPARDEEWAGRAQLLLGQWVRAKTVAYGLDPKNKGADGVWARDGIVVPKGTSLRVAGAVLSDGALLCHWPQLGQPGTDVQYRPVWLHQYEVELANEPKQIREAREGERLAARQDEEAKQSDERREGAARHLGTVRRFDEGFYAAVGRVLDALVPNQGDQGKVEFALNMPVGGVGEAAKVCLSLKLSFEAERDDEGIRARVEAGVGVMAQAHSDIVDAFVQAMLFGYLEASGDSGTEVMRLLSLAMYKTVQAQGRIGRKAAAVVWGKDFEVGVADEMDDNDSVGASLGIEVDAGIGIGDPLRDEKRGGQSAYRASRGRRYDNIDGDHQVEVTPIASTKLSIALHVFDGWVGSFSVESKAGRLCFEVELAREAELSSQGEFLSESNLREVLIHWAGTAFGQIHGLLLGQSGHQGQVFARQVGAMLSNIQNISFGPAFTEGAVVHALAKRIHRLKGLKLSQQLQGSLEIEQGTGTLSIGLSSLRAVEVGEARDPIHVLLQSKTQIARIKSKPFPI